MPLPWNLGLRYTKEKYWSWGGIKHHVRPSDLDRWEGKDKHKRQRGGRVKELWILVISVAQVRVSQRIQEKYHMIFGEWDRLTQILGASLSVHYLGLFILRLTSWISKSWCTSNHFPNESFPLTPRYNSFTIASMETPTYKIFREQRKIAIISVVKVILTKTKPRSLVIPIWLFSGHLSVL